ncbi:MULTISPECIES: helix-turn-helix domain-containing protein [Heyndrickxia]|uniref:helix-turn-helix domain-containing protein n=1 Tax=Heyndrickxia TaxID=2837504 RepID=UPI002DBE90BA|nr:helix-turn-helix transcriptional regulator [Weizmannia sp. CD-2023]MEC2225024.1 helix-turn-helix transcriptional regulator [Weizmannia sp. CD-2023]
MLRIRFCLEDILKEKNITQKQLAEMTGIREPSISTMKVNNRKVNLEHLAKIIEVLDEKDFNRWFKIEE